MFLLLNFTKLLDLLHTVELNVGNPNNKSMMNFEFHLPYLSKDPDWGFLLLVLAISCEFTLTTTTGMLCLFYLYWAWSWVVVLLEWLAAANLWACDLGHWCCVMAVYALPMLKWYGCGCEHVELLEWFIWCLSTCVAGHDHFFHYNLSYLLIYLTLPDLFAICPNLNQNELRTSF